ncbi:MAG: hypothetical protein AABX10_02090 [Nanoarchaeota archaeon]
MTRDKSHMDAVEKWAEFVRISPRSEWKHSVDMLINAVYEKADEFYKRLEKTEKGREILKRLNEDKINSQIVKLRELKAKKGQTSLF